MKKTVSFAAVFIAACLVFFPSCSGGSSGSSVSTDDLEGIWVATGEDEGTAKAWLFEFSGNKFTRIGYTVTPDPDMIQEEGNKGTYSISDDTLHAAVSHVWDDAQWDVYTETRSIPISYEGNTFTINVDGLEIEFTKKSFSRPSVLIDTWYDPSTNPPDEMEIIGDGLYAYDGDDDYAGTWSATSDLLRTITTDFNGTPMYIENLYEYEISGGTLTFSWEGTSINYAYTNVAP